MVISAAKLAEDRDFRSLVNSIRTLMKAQIDKKEDRKKRLERFKKIHGLRGKLRNARTGAKAERSLAAASGLGALKFREHKRRMKNAMHKLNKRHGLGKLPKRNREKLMSNAFAKADANARRSHDYTLHPISPNAGAGSRTTAAERACYDRCKAKWALASYGEISAYMGALAACTLTGPGWPICAAIATATYLLGIHETTRAAEACAQRCEDQFGSAFG